MQSPDPFRGSRQREAETEGAKRPPRSGHIGCRSKSWNGMGDRPPPAGPGPGPTAFPRPQATESLRAPPLRFGPVGVGRIFQPLPTALSKKKRLDS